MFTHRVPRRVWCLVLDAGDIQYLVPNVIYDLDGQPPVSIRVRKGRKEKRRLVPFGFVLRALILDVVADCLQALVTDRVAVFDTALFFDRNSLLPEIYTVQIDAGRRGAAHARFDQCVNDGPVPQGAVALALRPDSFPVSTPVARAAADFHQKVRGVKYL